MAMIARITSTIAWAAVLSAAAGSSGAVFAQAYPSKPIRLIVPFPAGGGVDYIGRIVGKGLSERLNQQVVIDNRPGANGILALENLKSSPPDGYTIAAVSAGPLAVNPFIYKKLPHDTLKDFTQIANMVNFPLLLVSHPSLPVKNVKELIALAKARPGEISYASPGAGNSSHLANELFNAMAKVNILHVPYKGMAPAIVSVVSGEGQILFASIPSILGHVRAGRVNALGVGNAKRVPSLPDFPTVAESGLPGFEAYAWAGMIGPAGVPRDIVLRLSKEIVAILNQKDVIDRMLADGTVPTPSGPDEFVAYMKSELKKWGDVVKLAGIKPE
jgi:tripartite-type tricarboxylate transporter receptor subunit TctC